MFRVERFRLEVGQSSRENIFTKPPDFQEVLEQTEKYFQDNCKIAIHSSNTRRTVATGNTLAS